MKGDYSILSLILLLLGCKSPNSSISSTIRLVDKDSLILGIVFCELPSDFDTTYQWFSSSDCLCCESMMYRSHSKKYKVVKESGFISNEKLDSGFYFTILHSPTIICDTQKLPLWFTETPDEIRKQNIEGFIKDFKKRKEGFNPEIIVDTGRVVNSHTYDIFYYNEIIGEKPFNVLSASTQHKDRSVRFAIQSNVHSTEDFYDLAMGILKGIKYR